MRWWIATCGLGLLAACGYGFAGRAAHLPPNARAIRVGPFQNHTDRIGVELALVSALEHVIRERGVLRVATAEGDGDLALRGTIRSFRFSSPVATSNVDRAVIYASVMILDAELDWRDHDQVLWQQKGLVGTRDIAVAPGVVIPSSPHFQQGTLNARDVSRLSGIQLAEYRLSQEVIRELIDDVARDIYDRMMEGF